MPADMHTASIDVPDVAAARDFSIYPLGFEVAAKERGTTDPNADSGGWAGSGATVIRLTDLPAND